MSEQNNTLIRFTGVLHENLTFEHVPAWETERVLERPPEGDPTFALDLLDSDGRVLTRVHPRVQFRSPEEPSASGLRLAEIIAYVPLLRGARTLVFRQLIPEVVELFRADIAERPPTVRDLSAEGTPAGKMVLKWQADHDRPLTFTIFYYPFGRRPVVVATRIQEPSALVDTSALPGPRGRFGVLATDGFRSGVAITQELDGFTTRIDLRIESPAAGSILPPDHPIDLIAASSDASGQAVEVDKFVWSVDDQEAAEGKHALATGLQPGEHRIVVIGLRGGVEVSRDTAAIKIADRTPEQEAFVRRAAELPPRRDRHV